ncbi:MAG: YdeI/OmpD-associated family protein [Candidatus Eremiobacteraeota bacterium]|nr:YdeI/OmpD-associated family protein [Candidatus Eremiobacteraeota bacterium]
MPSRRESGDAVRGDGDILRHSRAKEIRRGWEHGPDDLARARKAAKLRAAFDAMSYTPRKECVRSVSDAKRPETRPSRVRRFPRRPFWHPHCRDSRPPSFPSSCARLWTS